jgi:aspartokinase-like uncharacterized kinase
MSLRGREKFAWQQSELFANAARCAALADVHEHAGRRATVLLPAGVSVDDLPASWHVTSDSIAARIAVQVGAGRLVLVKALDRLCADGEPLPRLTLADLARLRPEGVDEHLPVVLADAAFETWVISGRDPARIAELLERGTTAGTRIAPARLLPWRHG